MDSITYSISDVCTQLDIKPHVLRYMEEKLNMEVRRDSRFRRCYTSADISLLRKAKDKRDEGMEYKDIRDELLTSEPIDLGAQNVSVNIITSDILMEPMELIPDNSKTIDDIKLMLQNVFSQSIESTIKPYIETINQKIDSLSLQNKELALSLEKQQERHFLELDSKLIKLREKRTKKSLFARLFNI